jgi:hypothetical protein
LHSSMTLACICLASSTALVLVDWISADLAERKSISEIRQQDPWPPPSHKGATALLLAMIRPQSRFPESTEDMGLGSPESVGESVTEVAWSIIGDKAVISEAVVSVAVSCLARRENRVVGISSGCGVANSNFPGDYHPQRGLTTLQGDW